MTWMTWMMVVRKIGLVMQELQMANETTKMVGAMEGDQER